VQAALIVALVAVTAIVLVVHMPTVSATARLAQTLDGAELRALGGDLFHPGIGLLVLLAITVINVYKPVGVTQYGWRKQREALQQNAQRTRPSATPHHLLASTCTTR
jgi:hypothetical protein